MLPVTLIALPILFPTSPSSSFQKNTTSKTQLIDAGIIASWNVKYNKRLLRYVCSKVARVKNARKIVKSVNVSMAIEWGK